MENRITIITIREGIAENEAALLWEQLLKLINGFKGTSAKNRSQRKDSSGFGRQ
ncbi:MAG: hypothetical protein ACLRR6_08565 [Oscillospiraceae bacterium]